MENRVKQKKFVSLVLYLHNTQNEVVSFFQKVLPVFRDNFTNFEIVCVNAVSYTHLDVYKRQLYLRDRKWKETFKCIICGMLLFFVPFLAFPGGLINVKVMIENIINCSNDFGTYRYGWKHNFNNFYNILNFITDVDFKKIYIVMCIFIVLIAKMCIRDRSPYLSMLQCHSIILI